MSWRLIEQIVVSLTAFAIGVTLCFGLWTSIELTRDAKQLVETESLAELSYVSHASRRTGRPSELIRALTKTGSFSISTRAPNRKPLISKSGNDGSSTITLDQGRSNDAVKTSAPSQGKTTLDQKREAKEPPIPESSSLLDDVVRKLLPEDKAHDYIKRFPGHKFRFYLYDDLPEQYTWQNISKCIRQQSNCDWGSTICTETETYDGIYSKRRFNRNGDIVVAKILDEYQGPLKTKNPHEADVFIVPYPSAGNCECTGIFYLKCGQKIPKEELMRNLLGKLKFYNDTSKFKHLFLSSNIWADTHSLFRKEQYIPLLATVGPLYKCELNKNCGRILVPYVNTNPENQPNVVHRNLLKGFDQRKFALSAFMANQIRGNSQDRLDFFEAMKGVAEIAGRPVNAVSFLHRNINDEPAIQQAYRDSIFCPCLRGDEPPQKRIFDVLLGGCIPIVLEHTPSFEEGWPSFFAPTSHSIRQTYPFSRGNFFNHTDMGVEFRDMVVALPADGCGIKCVVQTVEELLTKRPEVILAKQRNIAKYAALFSYGMEQNGLKYPDAVSAMLVQVRHYVNHLPKND